jgi:hypothetical protein
VIKEKELGKMLMDCFMVLHSTVFLEGFMEIVTNFWIFSFVVII